MSEAEAVPDVRRDAFVAAIVNAIAPEGKRPDQIPRRKIRELARALSQLADRSISAKDAQAFSVAAFYIRAHIMTKLDPDVVTASDIAPVLARVMVDHLIERQWLGPGGSVHPLPCATALRFLATVFGNCTTERVHAQIVADIRIEHIEARRAGRPWAAFLILVLGYGQLCLATLKLLFGRML